MTSVRDAFFNEIYNLVKNGEDIYIVTADLGAPSLDDFRRDFPDKYISVGIAEQTLITVAAGMALDGKRIIAYGLNPFPITRAFDQVRCLMAEMNIPLTLCVLNAGLCSAECGYTHLPIEDMAMLRTLSNVKTYNPSDESISICLANNTLLQNEPRIIRFDKTLKGRIYENVIDQQYGFISKGNKDSKIIVITYGSYIKELYEYYNDKLPEQLKIIDVFRIPVNKEALMNEIKNSHKIITIEENVKNGGLGSMVLEILSDYGINIRVFRLGLDFSKGYYDVFTNREYIRNDQKIDMDNIISTINLELKNGGSK